MTTQDTLNPSRTTVIRGAREEPALSLTSGEWSRLARYAARAELSALMADALAHELKNALTGIAGFAELVARQTSSVDPVVRHLDSARIVADKAATLLRSFTDFSFRLFSGATSMKMNTVIARLAGILPLVVPKYVDLEIQTDPDLGSIHADPSEIEQAILCLVAHACNGVPEGRKLTLKTTKDGGSDRPGEWNCLVTVSASDTGPGMAEATRAGLSEPAAALQESASDLRFALPAVAVTAKEYGGHVEVSCAPGQETTIALRFPRLDASSSRLAA